MVLTVRQAGVDSKKTRPHLKAQLYSPAASAVTWEDCSYRLRSDGDLEC